MTDGEPANSILPAEGARTSSPQVIAFTFPLTDETANQA